MALNYTIEKHCTGYPSKVLASLGGKHIFNVQLSEDVDNTWFVKKGSFIELDLYAEAAATTFEGTVVGVAANGEYYVEVVTPGDALFVYNVPMIEEEYNNSFRAESGYFNASGSVARCYELAEGDVISVSEKSFSAAPAVGDTVELKAITGKTAKQLGKKTA